ncbi:MAG TPA: 4Fe-4S cluster-binding domain-containing protein, partial [Tetragenococcus sp.]|nr:4Fe-4S cluster-binding domain-containing protein [Tetragenococcus sp.]
MKKPVIFNIQKFSVHDGPGIRSTVFFKGCPIRCKWCHNPESQNYHAELMKNKDGVEETIGKEYPIKELVNELLKDQLFYDQSGGGVTFSGGEVMTQPQHYVVETARRLHGRGINLAIDTCGVAPEENFAK